MKEKSPKKIENAVDVLGKRELYALLERGAEDIRNNRVMSAAEAFEKIEEVIL